MGLGGTTTLGGSILYQVPAGGQDSLSNEGFIGIGRSSSITDELHVAGNIKADELFNKKKR